MLSPRHPLYPSTLSRRELFTRSGYGAGMLALAGLLAKDKLRAEPTPLSPLAPKPSHFPARAKAVIWIFINGGHSQVDTWDYKPELIRRDGQELPGFDRHTGFFINAVGPLMRSPFEFRPQGQ